MHVPKVRAGWTASGDDIGRRTLLNACARSSTLRKAWKMITSATAEASSKKSSASSIDNKVFTRFSLYYHGLELSEIAARVQHGFRKALIVQ